MNGSGVDEEGDWGLIEQAFDGVEARRPARVLVVEAPVDAGDALAARLIRAGWVVRACSDGLAALHAFIRELPDLIVTSDRPVGLPVSDLVRRVREIADVPIVLVGTVDGPLGREGASRLGVDRFIDRGRELGQLSAVAFGLLRPDRRPHRSPHPITAAHVRRIARSQLRAELEKLLVECRGNLAEMARRMGRDRSTVRYHLRRFGMLVEEGPRSSAEPIVDGSHDDSAPA